MNSLLEAVEQPRSWFPIRIVLAYLAIGVTGIMLTDHFVFDVALSQQKLAHLASVRAWFITLSSAAVLYAILHRLVRALQANIRRLNHLAHHDPLTGLPNLNRVIERLHGTAARRRSSEEPLRIGLIHIDLDDFKTVNDRFGQQAGNDALRKVVQRFRRVVPPADTVARLGSDEFLILLREDGSVEGTSAVARKLRDSLRTPLLINYEEVVVTASLGICCLPAQASDAAGLLQGAAAAMLQAKQAGGDCCRLNSPPVQQRVHARAERLAQLRRVVPAQDFELSYCPRVDLTTARFTALEAQMSWRPAAGEKLSGAGLAALLDEARVSDVALDWLFDAACRQIAEWASRGVDVPPVIIPVTGRQLQDRMLTKAVHDAMDRFGVDPDRLAFSIGARTLAERSDQALRASSQLRGLGVGIGVSGMGPTGVALTTLYHLQPDWLALEGALVRALPEDLIARGAAGAVLALSAELRIPSVAEGVDSSEARNFLVKAGWDQAQGPLLGAARGARDLTPLVEAMSASPKVALLPPRSPSP